MLKSSPTVFLSYSHLDRDLQRRLVDELNTQNLHRTFSLWDDTQLQPGDAWHQRIFEAISESQVALLLVTENFLQSQFISEKEVPNILDSRITNGLRVIPVIVSECSWKDVDWLRGLQALPSSGTVVVSDDKATSVNWETIASEIRRVTELESIPDLPLLGRTLTRSFPYSPSTLVGLRVHPSDPFFIEFLVDPGDSRLSGRVLHDESLKLIRYFLVALTIPEEHMWVNLCPFEPNRIIPDDLGKTEVGRDLLRQDFVLKQLTASLIHPETPVGKMFWDRTYSELGNEGAHNTYNRTWITPQSATISESDGVAIVTESSLNVLLEEDYIVLNRSLTEPIKDMASPATENARRAANRMSQLVRELIVPELKEEVNVGRHFAVTRQVYSAAILASWFKSRLKRSILATAYAEKSRTAGLDTVESDYTQKVFQAYLKAYKKGVFNFIKEDLENEEVVPRKYFSGGFSIQHLRNQLNVIAQTSAQARLGRRARMQPVWVRCRLVATGGQSPSRVEFPSSPKAENPGGIELTVRAGRELKIESHGSVWNFSLSAAAVQDVLTDSTSGLMPVIVEMFRAEIQ